MSTWAESLASAYALNFGVPVTSLRLFTVYGPRQRPDMAIQRLIRCSLSGEPFTVYGDGRQIRAYTFVDDVIAVCEKWEVNATAIGVVTDTRRLRVLVGDFKQP